MSNALRFKGFALIVNTLLPFAVAIGLWVFLNTLYAQVRADLSPPARQLLDDTRALADTAVTAAQAVQRTTQTIQSETARAGAAVKGLGAPLANFRITLPRLVIPIPTGVDCRLVRVHDRHPNMPPGAMEPIPVDFPTLTLPPFLRPGVPQIPGPPLPRPGLPGTPASNGRRPAAT